MSVVGGAGEGGVCQWWEGGGVECVRLVITYRCVFYIQGKYMDIEFDFKGDPVGGIISKCKL